MAIRIRVHPQGAFGAFGFNGGAELARQQLDFERQKSMMQLDYERQLFQQRLSSVQMQAAVQMGGLGWGSLNTGYSYPAPFAGGYGSYGSYSGYSGGFNGLSSAYSGAYAPTSCAPAPLAMYGFGRRRGRRRRVHNNGFSFNFSTGNARRRHW